MKLFQQAGLENVTINDVREVLDSCNEEVTNEELLQIEYDTAIDDANSRSNEYVVESLSSGEVQPTNNIDKLTRALACSEELKILIEEIEPDKDRSEATRPCQFLYTGRPLFYYKITILIKMVIRARYVSKIFYNCN